MGIFDKVLRSGEGKKVRALASLVPDINAMEPEISALSDDALKAKTPEFRQRIANGEEMDDLLVEAFAVMREAANRVIGQRHFDVQLMGGAALHFGWVAEMKTGEGKTLVSTLPAYLNGVAGRGMHIITVNDYLASFHAEWMGRIHRWLGLEVGLIIPDDSTPEHKRAQYAADITYGTNNEFGFDYLRDNMALTKEQKTQRGHVFAIVDEVDSILIDEARTPLIISGRAADAAKLYYQFAAVVRGLRRDEDYEVDEEKRIVSPLEPGIEKVEAALGVENLYDGVAQNLVHQFSAALKAKELYKRDKDYIIQGGEVKIVDEFTGRILEGRRWSEGLHQAVEAKEGVKIKEENQTLATITLQNYFRMYEKLAGMTGTAQTEASELAGTYSLQVVPIPTNKPTARADEPDLIYRTEDAKYGAVVDDIVERIETGQPVLVGTVSVEKSEKLSRLLEKRGVGHEVLNAKQHTREAHIITQAGRLGSVTVATNMAGRGVDILLGGNPEGLASNDVLGEGLDPESDEGKARYKELLAKYEPICKAEGDEVREAGGLYVLGTERHESRRIDNQLRGRSGRQGDPGESRFYLSLEDELMRLFATGAMNWVMTKAMPDDIPIEAKMVTKAIERAQNTVEQRNAEIRKNVLQYDEVMNEQRKVIYRRRDQILDGHDLRDEALEALADAVESTISTFCVSDYSEEWDLEGLLAEIPQYWDTKLTKEELAASHSTDDLYQTLTTEGIEAYEAREAELTPDVIREVERQIMLRIIDQKWLEHLYEMDYLQEGIHLRAMGQKDPLVEWQREGFDMFGQMVHAISQDFVKYVMHAQVTVTAPEAEPALTNMQYSAPEDPSSAGSSLQRAWEATSPEERRARGRRRWRRRAARARGQHPRREERVGQDPAQRALPVRQRQEVQDVSREVGATEPLLRVEGLTKRYGAVTALDSLSCVVPDGTIGVVGANGAGKTTLFRILLGLARPSEGTIEVSGVSVADDPIGVRSRLGYMPEHECLPLDQTAADVVATFGELGGLPARAARQRASDVLDLVGLDEARFRPIGGFSTGMRQRAKLAQALVGDPALVLLDEPTAGLDPAGREEMLALVARLGAFHISVLMSTHLLDDVQQVCDHVLMIDAGRLVVEGPTEALLDRTGVVTIDVGHGTAAEQLCAALVALGMEAEVLDGAVELTVADDADLDRVRDVVAELGLPLYRLGSRLVSLDDVFLAKARS